MVFGFQQFKMAWAGKARGPARSEKQEYRALQATDSDNESPENSTRYKTAKGTRGMQIFSVALMATSCVWMGWSLHSFYLPHSHFQRVRHPGVPNYITDPVVSEVFMIDPLFNLERTDKQSEDAWLAYESRFVEIHDPEQYGLPPSTQLVEGGPHAYSLAAYHQLHCLAVVRFAWHTLLNNGSAALEQPFPGQAHFSEGYTIGSHMGHCVEIIRHALTCYADATLEPLFQEDGIHPSKEIASGWGVHHTCRNLDSLTSWADSKSIHIYAKGDLNG